MRIAVVGGGPGGLFFATLIRRADPAAEVTVFERNRADDTFGFGVVFSDRTLAGIHQADPVLREALTVHGRHWDEIEVRLKGERVRCGGNGMAAVARKTLLRAACRRAPARSGWTCASPPKSASADLSGYDLVVAADGTGSQDPRPTARRRRRPGHDGRDRQREVHLVRHRLPVRGADLRARAQPGRGVRGARLPDFRRDVDVHRGDRRGVVAAGGPGRVRRHTNGPRSRAVPATWSARSTWRSCSPTRSTAGGCWSTTPAGPASAPAAPGAGTF